VNAGPPCLAGINRDAFCRWPEVISCLAVTGEAAFILLEGMGRAGLGSSPGASVSGRPKPKSKIGQPKAARGRQKRLSVFDPPPRRLCVPIRQVQLLLISFPSRSTPWDLLARLPGLHGMREQSLVIVWPSGAGMTSIVAAEAAGRVIVAKIIGDELPRSHACRKDVCAGKLPQLHRPLAATRVRRV